MQERWFVLDIASMSIPYYTSENEQLSELKGMEGIRKEKRLQQCVMKTCVSFLPSFRGQQPTTRSTVYRCCCCTARLPFQKMYFHLYLSS